MTTPSSPPVIPGYKISSQLYVGSRTTVYRAIREPESLAVVMKMLTSEYPSFNELLQFRNQYNISKNLNIPGIIRPLSLEYYGNGYILVMEDNGEISLQEYIKTNILSIVEFLEIAIQLTNILRKLHQSNVIHKDIKPANILIHPQTKQVKLIDFSIASLLPKETQEIKSPNILEGTLAYISPEQTGRMNRGIDYRSDFYSLGVTFYELLTGELPFTSDDLMELVHCHIAQMPMPLSTSFTKTENRGEIPQVLSDIVMKLMAKNAEDRYQSGLGLKYDLENCLEQLKETGKIYDFEIAQRDVCYRFLIPEKLYGREKEVSTLLKAFDRVTNGTSEMMLVAGFSGIGKTAIVNEVHKPITRQQGYFIKGKFDQFNRNIPLSAFVQAFRDLMGQLLSENDVQLATWRTKILAAVGENGQVIVEVIPEVEQIIGKQPPITELSGAAAQNRFNLLFQKFIQVFATKEHPLVIFLDDLQWTDLASLQLLQLLMNEVNCGYLLILGAYRDNEVFPAHPLMLTLEQIQKAGAVVNTITLQPLEEMTVNHLLADTLNCSEELAQPLTQLVYQKTKGNPFFTTQFLKALHENGWIQFQPEQGYWECNIAVVRQLALTDDVVEFMALQLQKLSVETQAVLKLAGCIGNKFDLTTLAVVSEKSLGDTAKALWKALQEGLILPQGQLYKLYVEQITPVVDDSGQTATYKFLHDRVQQAAYSLIPEDQKQITHLQIGQLLLHNTSKTEREERIFEIVNQLNMGMDLITEPEQRNELAHLNLIAGRKAKVANAYAASFEYLMLGIELLPLDSWLQCYDLTRSLYESAAEVAYLGNNFEEMERLIEVVLKQTPTLLDRIKVYDVKIQGYGSQNEFPKALDVALTVLNSLGFSLPESPSQSDIQQALAKNKTFWQEKAPLELIGLPEMEMVESKAAMQILSSIIPIAYQVSPPLFVLSVLKQVDLSLQYGNTDLSAHAYAAYGCILCSMTGEIEEGFDFGQLSLTLLEKFPAKELKAKSLYPVSAIVTHWRQFLGSTLKPLLECYTYALESGDLFHTAWAIYMYGYHSYFMGKELSELEQEMTAHSEQISKIRQESVSQIHNICRQAIFNLMGMNDFPWELRGSAYDEQIMVPLAEAANNQTTLCKYYIQKLILCYWFDDQLTALKIADLVEPYLNAVVGYVDVPLFHFYDSLARLSVLPQIDESEREGILTKVGANQEKMKKWAHHSPSNYLHKFELVEAERHQVLGNKAEALDYYDRAIAKANENSYIQEEGLGNELAAKFYLNWGKEKIAAGYMQEAYYCYARWGAKAKNSDLEKRYPQLLKPILQQQQVTITPLETIEKITFVEKFSSTHISTSGNTSISDALDFASILKAAQTISSSIELDRLVTSLTKIILENSGAKKSVLILPKNETWHVKAITFINHQETSPEQIQTILDLESIETCKNIPRKIINYVKNTQETILIDNCQTDISGIIEEYMLEYQPQSILCTPIINQGNLVGILYLENQLTSGVFTKQRLQVINLLSSQAAISLENARLYQQAQQALKDLQQAQLKIVQSEKMSALGNLVAGVAHEMNNPLGFILATLQQTKPIVTDIIEHLKLYQETFSQASEEIIKHADEIDLDYNLEDLPKMIDLMVVAANRLKNISISLRTFSRADKYHKVKFNIHNGLDSTILILKHRLKANTQRPAIEVITDYGDLPQVDCFPGQLNQVFMNILANAIDALDDSNDGRSFQEIKANPNKIIIKTITENEQVKISISDNGKGISPEVKTRIFDHLFTTKEVGKGTGLGLAIAKQIIEEKHEGRLEVESELGKGTSFYIQLPIIGEKPQLTSK
ncbi:trifunctional serine/threonine-protein kinase/ATP-binding protein/sensor histidine kinase [Dapis sp. BLCC M126]|uniref:trifunctional serine/threonine-protein kinase/ATP-binding protein/sensor histidine kinase n=1 Tax=Dapis sp. BLCC M126 TaxID=3400189 RepID=UPI003CEC9096